MLKAIIRFLTGQREPDDTGNVYYPWPTYDPREVVNKEDGTAWGHGGFMTRLTPGYSVILNMQSGRKARWKVLKVKNDRRPFGSDHFDEIYQDILVRPIEYVD